MRKNDGLITGLVTVAGLAALGFGMWMIFLRTPVETDQIGFRGVAMETPVFADDKQAARTADINQALPEIYPREPDDGTTERAGDIYENVQVLGNLSDANFNRFMAQITEWVAPDDGEYDDGQLGGCAYCHEPEPGAPESAQENYFAHDYNYAKIVARRMIQMTQHLNSEWSVHVRPTDAGAGVNCYTCHRGMPVPQHIWFREEGNTPEFRYMGAANGQNLAVAANGYSSLNVDPFTPYFVEDREIRVNNDVPISSDYGGTIQMTEGTYALMIHMSQSLGVNCTFCHNSRAFSRWELSPAQRAPAWHAIRMLRDLNNDYLIPLQPVYPEKRLGEFGDAPKANCTTCHYGVNKPLYGADMVSLYPSLLAPGAR